MLFALLFCMVMLAFGAMLDSTTSSAQPGFDGVRQVVLKFVSLGS
jgi:hypothetical protein